MTPDDLDSAELVSIAIQKTLSEIPGLGTLAPGGVRNGTRRQGAEVPVIVHAIGPGGYDSPGYGGVDSVEYINVDIKVIASEKLQANVGVILRAIHVALQGKPLDLGGGYLSHMQTLSLRRIPQYAETAGSTTYLHRGRTYQVTVSHTP